MGRVSARTANLPGQARQVEAMGRSIETDSEKGSFVENHPAPATTDPASAEAGVPSEQASLTTGQSAEPGLSPWASTQTTQSTAGVSASVVTTTTPQLPKATGPRSVDEVPKRLIVYVPHPDDELLSMWPAIHYLASGYDVHFVFMSRGPVSAYSLRLDGVDGSNPRICTWPEHGYIHNPTIEGYQIPTVEELGLARLHEGISCIGAMAAIAPVAGQARGYAYWHDEQLPTNWGSGGGGSSTGPLLEQGIQQAYDIQAKYIALYPNSIHWTMSPTDDHVDHAACGVALRRHKTEDPALAGARFFVSKLYWGDADTARPADVLAEQETWYPNPPGRNDMVLDRRAEYTEWIRHKVMKAYTAWNPAEGSWAIGGGHSVPSQFANCFGSGITVASALWHP